MKFLFIFTNRIQIADIPWALMELGHEVKSVNILFNFEIKEEENEQKLEDALRSEHYDAVVTYNFVTPVSNVCHKLQIPYLSWVFDSPELFLYREEARRDCNFIFLFDHVEYERLKSKIKHLYYLPLAANISRMGSVIIEEADLIKFSEEVSFVGGAYEESEYQQILPYLPNEIKESMEQSMEKLYCHYQGCKQESLVKPEQVAFLDQYFGEDNIRNELDLSAEQFYADYYFTKEVASRERKKLLEQIAKKHAVSWYSYGVKQPPLHVQMKGPVSYDDEMIKVFYLSKINLNMTIHSIASGLPQRIFDILGAGGFLLTNYQPELELHFTPGKDCEVYHSQEELIQKVDYYLKHDEIRQKIAQNGYYTVKQKHTCKQRMNEMIKQFEKELK